MGGHGGLNILPQKEWNVYRVDRQFQVKYDYHRKVESELANKEAKRKKRYNDTLIKLKRDRQRSRSSDRNDKSESVSDEASNETANDEIKSAVKRHMKQSFMNRYKPNDDQSDDSTDDEIKRLRGDDSEDPKLRRARLLNKKVLSGKQILPDDQPSEDNPIIPFRLFEKEEKRDLKRQKEQRDKLLKASCYVYNGTGRNSKQINIYTDTTEDGKQNLVSDFKQFAEAPSPWYSKRCDWYKSKKSDSIKSQPSESIKSKFDVNSIQLNDNLLKERLDREAKERARAQQLKMSRGVL